MAIGDPPGNVYTEHPDGSISNQSGYLTNDVQYADDVVVYGSSSSNSGWNYGPVNSSPDIDYFEPTDTRNWWQRNASWLVPVLGAVGSIGTGNLFPVIASGLFGLWQNHQQNKYNKENYEIQKKDALEAEQRANDEYDRRQADARQYNDAWADRLRAQGFNPLAVLSKGGGVTATTSSAPSTTSMPLRQSRTASLGSISQSMSQMMNILSTTAALKQQQATTENIKASTELTQAETESKKQLNESFWERFNNEMKLLTANLRNQNAVADINESLARVRVATEQNNIDEIKYSTLRLYYDMKAAQFAPEIANQQLALLGQEYLIGELRKSVAQNELTISGNTVEASNMNLIELKQYYAERAETDAVAREVAAGITAVEQQAAHLSKDNNWYGADKVFGYINSVGHTVAAVASVAKPGALPANSTTTTRSFGNGNRQTTTTYYR